MIGWTEKCFIIMQGEIQLIDSTTITVGKSRLPWAVYHDERSGINCMSASQMKQQYLLKSLKQQGSNMTVPLGKALRINALSSFVIVRIFQLIKSLCDALPIEWRIFLKEILAFYRQIFQIETV